jgi:hypothetical protein
VGGECGYRMRDKCNAMQMMVRYDATVPAEQERAVTGKALPNFLAGEEEQPLQGQFNLHLDLPFNTVDNPPLEARFSVLTGGTMQGYVRTLSYDHARAGEENEHTSEERISPMEAHSRHRAT